MQERLKLENKIKEFESINNTNISKTDKGTTTDLITDKENQDLM